MDFIVQMKATVVAAAEEAMVETVVLAVFNPALVLAAAVEAATVVTVVLVVRMAVQVVAVMAA